MALMRFTPTMRPHVLRSCVQFCCAHNSCLRSYSYRDVARLVDLVPCGRQVHCGRVGRFLLQKEVRCAIGHSRPGCFLCRWMPVLESDLAFVPQQPLPGAVEGVQGDGMFKPPAQLLAGDVVGFSGCQVKKWHAHAEDRLFQHVEVLFCCS
eukprot:gnl/MRDRNA2_/MRDRNA2_83994_c0_seq1.p1 gnl/MRDRNA2_/MRDRNA2_83994_c0~~gnl/MRDRNA2_/MRDRNA2_83994_c0_seq1.p1  ORF type:complete len:151 (-),score=12.01 gnl/MRDRNA2_/MRDRNA2_83994_c0_seq1:232-684(-)